MQLSKLLLFSDKTGFHVVI